MTKWKKILTFLCVIVIGSIIGISCTNNDNQGGGLEEFHNEKLAVLQEESEPNLVIKQGVVSQKADTFRIIRNGETVAIIRLGEPIIVVQAEMQENWGYYQFPKIYRARNKNLIVKWQMKADSPTAYGKDGYGYLMSRDEGYTWEQLDQKYFQVEHHRVDLSNGDILQIETPASTDISKYAEFAAPVNTEPISDCYFYVESELPNELTGVYLTYWNRQKDESIPIHAKLNDPGMLRSSVNNMLSVVWWGDMKEINDGSIVAGVYPGYYQNSDGKVLRSAVSFYKSTNNGYSWDLLSKIPYQVEDKEPETFVYDGSDGFTEPAFEILNNGKYLCVMRTSSTTPMCRTFSSDGGITWSHPQPFTPNGVMPRLMLLDNNSLVLASGRPGMQIRFNLDGDGDVWTEPIEMMPYMDEDGKYDIWHIGCGYPNLLKAGENTFYIVYSDFKAKNSRGEERNTVLFRKIEVIKK